MRRAALVIALAACACGDRLGEEGGPCNRRGLCLAGLVCGPGAVCAKRPASPDAGVHDAAPADAARPDAAPITCDTHVAAASLDGGVCVTPDSGVPGYVLIRPGTFTMGSPAGELGRDSSEAEHAVTITQPFLLKQTEVTQCEWRAVIGTSPSYFSSCGDRCPVERVSWFDAIAYLNALSDREGLPRCYLTTACTGPVGTGCANLATCTEGYSCASVTLIGLDCAGYRLPTEAEWEYATRAGTTSAFWNGAITDDFCTDPTLDRVGWYCGNSGNTTHEVGTKPLNPWCLADVHGNVLEWVHDWFMTYPTTALTDPPGPAVGTDRVFRGGSWFFQSTSARSAKRYHTPPVNRLSGVGFRPARTAP